MKCGATDFLSKPVAHEDLRKAINKALDAKVLDYRACLPGTPSAPPSGFSG